MINSCSEPGEYSIEVTYPNGDVLYWSGYADNASDALCLALFARKGSL